MCRQSAPSTGRQQLHTRRFMIMQYLCGQPVCAWSIPLYIFCNYCFPCVERHSKEQMDCKVCRRIRSLLGSLWIHCCLQLTLGAESRLQLRSESTATNEFSAVWETLYCDQHLHCSLLFPSSPTLMRWCSCNLTHSMQVLPSEHFVWIHLDSPVCFFVPAEMKMVFECVM